MLTMKDSYPVKTVLLLNTFGIDTMVKIAKKLQDEFSLL